MEKLKMHSPNKVDENIEKIGALFPNCLTETINDAGEVTRAIDFDMLKQELSSVIVEGNEERYQFTWPDKKKSILLANSPIAATLRPCREESVDFDNTENLYIEGDNLDVLKLLQETYLGKIKMIYIDPPYNTGNDFVYEDDFAESIDEYLASSGQYDEEGNRLVQNAESNGRFHTDWLNMLYPRLKVAKDLLTEDGCVFISIDDNELHNLIKVCDEIFGEVNFVGCITRATGTTTGQDANKIGSSLDYCVVYSKSSLFSLNGVSLDENDAKRFSEQDERGKFSILQLRKTGNADRKEDRPNMFYPVTAPDGSDVYPIGPSNYLSRWRVGRDKFEQFLADDMVVWKESGSGNLSTIDGYKKSKWTPYVKYYLEGRTKQVSNLFQDIEGNKKASIVLRELFGAKGVFDNPKPLEFMIRLIQIATNNKDIILDFFSGSATTGHAVMKFNMECGSNRKFVMVQLPEETGEKSEAYKAGYKNICEIGKERIRRAGKKIKEENPEAAANLDTGFRVLKLDSSNMKDVYYNSSELTMDTLFSTADNIKEDRTPEDLLFQVMLDLGVLLSSKIEESTIAGKKVFNVAEGYLIACFDANITDEVIAEIAKKKPYYFVMRDSSMASDSVAANFDQIFATYSPETVRKVL